MTDLSARSCKACEGGLPALSRAQAQSLLTQVSGWTLNDAAKGYGTAPYKIGLYLSNPEESDSGGGSKEPQAAPDVLDRVHANGLPGTDGGEALRFTAVPHSFAAPETRPRMGPPLSGAESANARRRSTATR